MNCVFSLNNAFIGSMLRYIRNAMHVINRPRSLPPPPPPPKAIHRTSISCAPAKRIIRDLYAIGFAYIIHHVLLDYDGKQTKIVTRVPVIHPRTPLWLTRYAYMIVYRKSRFLQYTSLHLIGRRQNMFYFYVWNIRIALFTVNGTLGRQFTLKCIHNSAPL